MRPALIAALLSALIPAVPAAEVPGKQPVKSQGILDRLPDEEKWKFRPTPGRPDVFVDLEALMKATTKAGSTGGADTGRGAKASRDPTPASQEGDQLLGWARGEELKIRQAVGSRRYDEAIKLSDASIKLLEANAERPDLAQILVTIRTYRAQAEEAKIRDEAQAAFDGLKIRVLGVLWSHDGARLALIEGEGRAMAVNDRVKDTVIVNVDQDRVDFRFHYNRRRFEFPCYVEQQGGAPAARARSR
jgi:hypothetical protein